MSTLAQRIISLAQAIGDDFKTIINKIGSLPSLNTADKTSVVAAINELSTSTTKIFIQQTEPVSASPYIWYKLDEFGNVIDILKG